MKKRLMLLVCCMMCMVPSVRVQADETTAKWSTDSEAGEELPSLIIQDEGTGESTNNQYNNVLQVVVSFTTEDGELVPIQGGSGFLIGADETELQYMITTNEIVDVSDDIKKTIKKKYRLEKEEDVQEEIKIVVNKDVTVAASVVTASEEMDFAILQLSQPLHDRQALLLNDKSSDEYLREEASVLGYPSSVKYGKDMVYYTGVDLQKTAGFLETEQVFRGQTYLQHHIFPNYGNLGGPIIDANNAVVALNQSGNDGKNFYALKITEIIHVLDSLGIPYKTVSQAQAQAEAELAAVVHKEELNKVINQAENIVLDDYKEKSITGYEDVLKNAKDVQKNEDATQEEVNEAVATLQESIAGLVPKTPLKVILMIVGIVAVVIAIAVVIILKVTSKSRKAKKEKREAEFTVTEPAPVFNQRTPMMETSYKDIVQAGNEQVGNQSIWNMQVMDGNDSEQTTVLGAAMDDSTGLLKQPTVTLIRVSNNDNILVHKFPFVLGKDKAKADYCIQNNSAVSRIHANLLYEGNAYYIQDNNATNGTFVNGNRVVSGSKVVLQNNDKITLGNESFDFRTSL